MSVNFSDMPWLVTVTVDATQTSDTYGPQTMAKAVALRDDLRVAAAPGHTIEAWAAQVPNPQLVKSPDDAWIDVAA